MSSVPGDIALASWKVRRRAGKCGARHENHGCCRFRLHFVFDRAGALFGKRKSASGKALLRRFASIIIFPDPASQK
jgi:hypothetical protein